MRPFLTRGPPRRVYFVNILGREPSAEVSLSRRRVKAGCASGGSDAGEQRLDSDLNARLRETCSAVKWFGAAHQRPRRALGLKDGFRACLSPREFCRVTWCRKHLKRLTKTRPRLNTGSRTLWAGRRVKRAQRVCR